MARDLILIAALVLALRLPFLNQPIQGDDIYYLAGAQHAQIDPAHPHGARYLFQGRMVDMRGHPHPPLNAWLLGALLALTDDVDEKTYHAAYSLFSLAAAFGMYALARRFTPHALAATVLFCAVPAFVINGNSLESDLPFLAFWMLGLAAFWHGRYALAILPLGLAGLAAYQSVLAIPILWLHLWQSKRRANFAYLAAATPALVLLAYQIFEPRPPVAVAFGYFQEYGLQQFKAKLSNAAALTGHLGWMLFPALGWLSFGGKLSALALPLVLVEWHPLYLIGAGIAIAYLLRSSARYAWWPHIFFAGALVLFFAGSARYLLPMAAPLVLAAVEAQQHRPRYLYLTAAAQFALSLSLAWVNYQHWDAYRAFATKHAAEISSKRTWVNGEWGLRHYTEAIGALPLAQGQAIRPASLLVSSELGYPIPFTAGGGQLVTLDTVEVRPTLPLRLIGLEARSGYSTASAGVRPFDIRNTPVDRIRIQQVLERQPTLSALPMGSADSAAHILSGAYQIEDGQYRWIGREAKFLLKPARETMDAYAVLYIPDAAPARRLTLEANGRAVADVTYPKPGLYTLEAKGIPTGNQEVLLTLRCDKTFQAPGDTRELGLILREAGLR